MAPFTAQSSIDLHASLDTVWDAITKPELVKQYFFGTDMVTDWGIGSPIFFRGEWEGKAYEDKGFVLTFEPKSSLSYNYWSSFSGIEDSVDHYQVLTYALSEHDGVVTLTITQSNAPSQEVADHSANNWNMVLAGLKKLVEQR